MGIALVVVAAAVTAAILGFAASAVRAVPDPIEPVAEERAVVRALRRHPRLQRFLRQRLDRRTAGGLLLTVGAVVTFFVAVVIGVLLDMVDGRSGLAAWDDQIAAWGSEHATSAAVDVLKVVTHLGGTWVVLAALVAASLSDFLAHRRAEVFAFAAIVFGGEKLIVNGLKALIDRERPDILALVSFSGPSFPSGHAAAAAACWPAVALILSRHRPRLARAVLAGGAALIAVAVAASRALLGVHWLTDVIGGLALGYGWFVVVAVAFGGRAQRLGDPVEVAPAGVTAEPERAAAGRP